MVPYIWSEENCNCSIIPNIKDESAVISVVNTRTNKGEARTLSLEDESIHGDVYSYHDSGILTDIVDELLKKYGDGYEEGGLTLKCNSQSYGRRIIF